MKPDLVLIIWTSVCGIGFFAYYHHPKVQNHPAFFWASIACLGYALSRYVYLHLPEGTVRGALLVLQYISLMAAFVFVAASVKVVLPRR